MASGPTKWSGIPGTEEPRTKFAYYYHNAVADKARFAGLQTCARKTIRGKFWITASRVGDKLITANGFHS